MAQTEKERERDNNFQANYADAIAQGLDVFLDLSQSLARCPAGVGVLDYTVVMLNFKL